MYFNSTLTDSSKLLKPLLVFSFMISAIICGLTRIIQYKNHAVDVYLGFLLGGAIAVYLVRTCLSATFQHTLFGKYGNILSGKGLVFEKQEVCRFHSEYNFYL